VSLGRRSHVWRRFFEALEPYAVSWAEAQVASLLCDYATNQEIAECLGVSASAVKKRMRKLKAKVGGENRRELALRVRKIVSGIGERWPEARSGEEEGRWPSSPP